MDVAKLLTRQLRAAARLTVTADEKALIAWWESQVESIGKRAPAWPELPAPEDKISTQHPAAA